MPKPPANGGVSSSAAVRIVGGIATTLVITAARWVIVLKNALAPRQAVGPVPETALQWIGTTTATLAAMLVCNWRLMTGAAGGTEFGRFSDASGGDDGALPTDASQGDSDPSPRG